jgi:hypothetical protein
MSPDDLENAVNALSFVIEESVRFGVNDQDFKDMLAEASLSEQLIIKIWEVGNVLRASPWSGYWALTTGNSKRVAAHVGEVVCTSRS